MQRLYLHIGMPKTGSSAIQAFLILNSQTLYKNEILFPNPPEFTQPFQTSEGNARFLYEFLYNNDIQKFKEYLDSFDNEATVLLSSESLFATLRDNPQCLFQALENYSYKIICYVRRQDEIFSSWYNQMVKNHNETNRPKIDKIAEEIDFALPLSQSLNYCQTDRFIIRPYEKQQFFGGNIFADFLHCIGIELTDEYVFPETIVNPSLSKEALEFRRLLNILEIDRDDAKKKNHINRLLGQYTVEQQMGRPFQKESNIFTAEERIRIFKDFKEKNQFIARVFLDRKNGKLFYDSMPSENNVQGQVSLSIFDAIDICRFLDMNKDQENAEEELIKSLAQGTAERIFKSEIVVQTDKMPVIYRMQEDPVYCSQDVTGFENKFGFWVIESSGSDPNFILPNYDKNANEGELVIEIKITASSDTLLQLFYISDNLEFDPEHCLSQRLQKGYNEIILKIDETSPISSLRIDPSITTGIYLLHDILVRNPMKTVNRKNSPMTYRMDKYPERCSPDVKAIEKKNDAWQIESCGSDPFIILSDFHSYTNEGELWVEIHIAAPFDTEFQLFYLTDNPEFDPYHCRSRYLNKGDNKISLYIHEQHPITALRLDPGTTEGIYILHDFTVKSYEVIK